MIAHAVTLAEQQHPGLSQCSSRQPVGIRFVDEIQPLGAVTVTASRNAAKVSLGASGSVVAGPSCGIALPGKCPGGLAATPHRCTRGPCTFA